MNQQCSHKSMFDGWHYRQCRRKGTAQREGQWYCFQHDPVAIKAKDDKITTNVNATIRASNEREAQRKENQRKLALFPELVAIVRLLMEDAAVEWGPQNEYVQRAEALLRKVNDV